MKKINWFIISLLGVAGSIASIYSLQNNHQEDKKTTFGNNSPAITTEGNVTININEKKKETIN